MQSGTAGSANIGRMIGLSTAPTWPAVFMQPATSPAWGPAMSWQTPQQAPSRKLADAPARATRGVREARRAGAGGAVARARGEAAGGGLASRAGGAGCASGAGGLEGSGGVLG